MPYECRIVVEDLCMTLDATRDEHLLADEMSF